ncbi:hypothetical protein [Embleya hyalina]|uniref:Secreted protein n=1 Tax=Embleya hyalina TaxID=516124 RepID=A0A401YZV0_9ACTN|nr:hypothetical protein [Embleya hyalina]GCE00160.1 hypothetical protein EHYA_07885 [Embleya hyalina]
MKLRNAAGAAVAALALVLSLPGTSVAAEGRFHYKYVDTSGREHQVTLHDPRSGVCIDLYGVGSDDVPPGYGPHNETDSRVTVYRGADCTGAEWRLKPHGKPTRDDLEVRSVLFDVAD